MLKVLHNLFIPHHRNNYRSKLLHNSSLFFLFLLLVSITVGGVYVKNKHPEILGISYSISESEMLNQVNNIRRERNLGTLSLNSNLSAAASLKAQDMFAKNYWAHFAPDGSTSPWLFIKNSGYNYLYAGENLAKGFTNSGDIVNAWMNSPSHRENLLSEKYKDIGFAIVEGNLMGEDTVLVVQMFGSTEYPTAVKPQQPPLAQVQEPAKVETAKAPQVAEKPTLLGKKAEVPSETFIKPKIDVKPATKSVSIFILSVLLFAFVMDLVIVEKNKIPRLVGHNLDHIMLVMLFAIFIIFQNAGFIL